MLSEQSLSQKTVIVGGGPSGLATALMLAKRGWRNITVLEKRQTADYYEPDKAFSYQIDGRGQKFTDLLGLTQQLSEISVHSTEFYLTILQTNGDQKTRKLPIVDPNRKTAYWLPRRTFVLLLYQEIEKNWQDQIQVLFNTRCIEINQNSNNLELIAEAESGEIQQFEPTLVVGCDGLNSIVRHTLQEWEKNKSDRFDMKLFPSPSSDLKYKVLTLPPQFPLSHTGEEQAMCDRAYAIRGTSHGGQQPISLGLLPLKNPDIPRTANIITKPNHPIWNLKTREEFLNYLDQSFPQIPLREIVSPSEIDRFLDSEGGAFPVPQYCEGFHYLLESSSENSGGSILLLGDAVHCFPPDIGQGVNSALEDVYLFNQALEESNNNLTEALPLYESWRSEDVPALICLAQTAFPWQYNQDQFGRMLWSLNFFLRLFLNRLFPFVFSPPAFLLIQNHELDYEEIWRQAEQTSLNLKLFGLTLIGLLLILGEVLGD